MNNIEIKRKMKANFIPQWQVADMLGISEMTLTRWLRKELTKEQREKIECAIEILKRS